MTRLCGRCGKAPARADWQAWCNDCHAEWMRLHRSPLTGDARVRANARSVALVAVRRGKLHPRPCEVCGEREVWMLHLDYSRPLMVRWLCRTHHRAARSGVTVPLVQTGDEVLTDMTDAALAEVRRGFAEASARVAAFDLPWREPDPVRSLARIGRDVPRGTLERQP